MDILVSLDVLLGLSVVYLVFSLAVTSLNEFIAAVLSSRANWLRRGIASLLSENPDSLDDARAGEVLNSPFVTYLGTSGICNTFKASYIAAWPLMQGVLSSVAGFKEDAFAKVSDIRALAEQLPEKSPIRKILIDICARAGHDLVKFREMLDAWFKTFEEQLTAWYRQKTQYVLVVLSSIVVGAMNVDTVALIHQLSVDPAVRKVVSEQATTAAKTKNLAEYLDVKARDQARNAWNSAVDERKKAEDACRLQTPIVPDCAKSESVVKASQAERAAEEKLVDEQGKLDQVVIDRADALRVSGLKLGWEGDQFSWQKLLKGDQSSWQKLMGLLLSVFAVSLGAPFWFGALKSLASIRSVGANVLEREAAKKA